MTELLILAILLEGEFTGYKIKHKIKSNFSVFLSASFGSIHPALKKLEKSGFISTKRKMSNGGQKSSFYSVTPEGKKYFKELMSAEIADSPLFSNQLINIKLVLLDLTDENLRKETVNSIKRYYEIQLLNTEELLEKAEEPHLKNKEKNFMQIKFLKHHADKISRELNWIQSLI